LLVLAPVVPLLVNIVFTFFWVDRIFLDLKKSMGINGISSIELTFEGCFAKCWQNSL